LIIIYKNEDLIETNKNTRTKLRFCYKNEDQQKKSIHVILINFAQPLIKPNSTIRK